MRNRKTDFKKTVKNVFSNFKFEILKKAHQMAEKKNILTTDDASLVEMIFGKVKIIYGDYDNIKITVQEDLKFLK